MKTRTPLLIAAALAAGCSTTVGPGEPEVGIAMNGTVALHYTVDFPLGEGPFPTVAYGPGSGNVSVGSSSVVEHARRIVALGFAVIRYDKRGVGDSDGDLLSLSTANSEDVVPTLAADMLAVLRDASQLARVDGSRLGLFGASQANWYLPLVAAETPSVDWMIVLTGGLLPVGPKNEWERLVFFEDRDPFAQSTLDEWARYSGPLGFDQRPALRELDRPMLYLLGGRDPGVPLGPMLIQADSLRATGVDITVETYPEGEHLLDGIDFWGVVSTWLTGVD